MNGPLHSFMLSLPPSLIQMSPDTFLSWAWQEPLISGACKPEDEANIGSVQNMDGSMVKEAQWAVGVQRECLTGLGSGSS